MLPVWRRCERTSHDQGSRRKPRDAEPLIPKNPSGTQAKQVAELWEVVRIQQRKIRHLEVDADRAFDRAEALRAKLQARQ